LQSCDEPALPTVARALSKQDSCAREAASALEDDQALSLLMRAAVAAPARGGQPSSALSPAGPKVDAFGPPPRQRETAAPGVMLAIPWTADQPQSPQPPGAWLPHVFVPVIVFIGALCVVALALQATVGAEDPACGGGWLGSSPPTSSGGLSLPTAHTPSIPGVRLLRSDVSLPPKSPCPSGAASYASLSQWAGRPRPSGTPAG